MDAIEERALFIRLQAVEAEHLHNPEGLAMVVCPTPALRRASYAAARQEIETERTRFAEQMAKPRPQPPQVVRLIAA